MCESFQSAATGATAVIRLAKVSRPRPASRPTALEATAIMALPVGLEKDARSRCTGGCWPTSLPVPPADRSTPANAEGPPARSSAGQATASTAWRKPSTARRTCLSGSLTSSATCSPAVPHGGSHSSETSMLVLPPRSSNRTAPALSTSASPTLFQAMRWLGMYSVISASHSTDLPSGPETFHGRRISWPSPPAPLPAESYAVLSGLPGEAKMGGTAVPPGRRRPMAEAGTFQSLIAPRRYIQGRGVLASLGKHVAELGSQPLVIADENVWNLVGDRLSASFSEAGVEFRREVFGGVCSHREID